MSSIRNLTLAEQAYEELKARIVTGRLPAGRRLLADELATELAISPTPIKEALAELERDGLVETTARRASTVRRFSAEDIAEIFDARILIETNAIAAAIRARRVNAAFLDELRRLFSLQMRSVERRTRDGLAEALRYDREFHEAIVASGGNKVLSAWHGILLRQTQTIRCYSIDRYDATRSRGEHAAIIAALEIGKTTAAVKAMRAHLEASRGEMLSRPADDLPPRP